MSSKIHTIGSILRIDHNTDNGIRGRFAGLAVCVDLSKPLISKLKISRKTQRVEYESLPNVCFGCGRFGHNMDFCPHHPSNESKEGDLKEQPKSKGKELNKRVEEEQFGPWMLVERRQRRSSRTTTYKSSMVVDKIVGGSRFRVLDESLGKNNGENDSFDMINVEKDDARMQCNPSKSVYVPKKGKLIKRNSPNLTINKGKGKRITVSSGAKSNLRILKPSENRGEQSTGLGFSSIEDGSTLRSNKEK
ncbi:hypothetical protein PVK06_016718 [Gossypium arboreum]|uniref:CCHC-type domain-containing protein n=1 Tax=Gossypium arboreum TaxID=29729 RepID=A0ABR0Q174_GOSAR|nr:hypothetical protein PVK06_016718 [Gossypium arboreum]